MIDKKIIEEVWRKLNPNERNYLLACECGNAVFAALDSLEGIPEILVNKIGQAFQKYPDLVSDPGKAGRITFQVIET